MSAHDFIRGELTRRLEDLGARVERIEEEQRQPMDQDSMEQVVQREDDEALDAAERSALTEMTAIRQAFVRLDAGTYGICVTCGDVIAPARLTAMPAAAQCIGCASKVARDNG
jgi:RNA polymerase-binding transcription factor DksA